jgi:hypothetical protein
MIFHGETVPGRWTREDARSGPCNTYRDSLGNVYRCRKSGKVWTVTLNGGEPMAQRFSYLKSAVRWVNLRANNG